MSLPLRPKGAERPAPFGAYIGFHTKTNGGGAIDSPRAFQFSWGPTGGSPWERSDLDLPWEKLDRVEKLKAALEG